ncbi:helix-turn-helix transcriptional regulator [Thalassotalea mangrovi]|nr:AraC family transcriptional regulator [Thalassotalea mangrovi]
MLLVAFDEDMSAMVIRELPNFFDFILLRSMDELESFKQKQDPPHPKSGLQALNARAGTEVVVYALAYGSKEHFNNLQQLRSIFPESLIYLFCQNVSIPLLRVALRHKIEEVFMLPFGEGDKRNLFNSLDKNRILPAELMSLHRKEQDGGVRSLDSHKFQPIVELLDNIEKGFKKGTSIQDFSSDIPLSISRLCHMFKELTGQTCSQYLICRKLEESERLLAETNTPVTSIAYHLGFANPSHFSRAFKEHLGLTPKAFSDGDNEIRCSSAYSHYQKFRLEHFPALDPEKKVGSESKVEGGYDRTSVALGFR